MTNCSHGFVVRAAQGEYRFQCKECGERFIRHPEIIRSQEELIAAIAQEEEEERQREIKNGWKPRTHQENAKALVDLMFPDDKKLRDHTQSHHLIWDDLVEGKPLKYIGRYN